MIVLRVALASLASVPDARCRWLRFFGRGTGAVARRLQPLFLLVVIVIVIVIVVVVVVVVVIVVVVVAVVGGADPPSRLPRSNIALWSAHIHVGAVQDSGRGSLGVRHCYARGQRRQS